MFRKSSWGEKKYMHLFDFWHLNGDFFEAFRYLVSEIGKAGADLPVDFRFGVCSEIRLLLFGPETCLLHPL